MGKRRGRFGRDRTGGVDAAALLGGDLGRFRGEARIGLRLREAAGVEFGGKRLASGKAPVDEVGKWIQRPHEARLDLVEAAHTLTVMLGARDLARVEIVTVLLFRLSLTAQLRHVLLLTVLRARRE